MKNDGFTGRDFAKLAKDERWETDGKIKDRNENGRWSAIKAWIKGVMKWEKRRDVSVRSIRWIETAAPRVSWKREFQRGSDETWTTDKDTRA